MQVVVSECCVQVQVVVSECYVHVQVVQTENVRNRRDAELLAEVGGAGAGLHKGEALFSAHGSRVLKSTESALHWVDRRGCGQTLCKVGGVSPHLLRAARTGECPACGDLQERQVIDAATYAVAFISEKTQSLKGLE